MLDRKHLFSRYKNLGARILALELRIFKLENHLDVHPTDYQSRLALFELRRQLDITKYRRQEVLYLMEVKRGE